MNEYDISSSNNSKRSEDNIKLTKTSTTTTDLAASTSNWSCTIVFNANTDKKCTHEKANNSKPNSSQLFYQPYSHIKLRGCENNVNIWWSIRKSCMQQ